METSDSIIIQNILKGDDKQFEKLIRKNNPYLYKTGRSYGYSHEDTQDLMQETFISAYFNLEKFENRSTFKTWIIRIMLNFCFQRNRKFSFKNEVILSNPIHDQSTPMYSNPQQNDTGKTILNKELNLVIEKSLQQVPVDYRMVFSLREINGLNTSETAQALNISEANVKVRLNRAKAMLRQQIEKTYSPEDIFEFNLIHCDPMVSRVMNEIAIRKLSLTAADN